MINKSNIEEQLFNYFEGALTSSEKAKVEQFVDANPEFKTDFDAWEKSYLPQEEFTYDRVDELLVDESTGKSALFGRWKTGLLLLLVGAGLSFGLYQKINSNEIKKTASADAEKLEDTQDAEVQTNKRIADTQNNQEQTNANGELAVSNTQSAPVVTSASRKINLQKEDNIAQVGGGVKTNVVNPVQVQGNNTSSSSVPVIAANTKSASNVTLKALLAEKAKYQNIDIGLETSSVEELLSTPRIKKSRSKFEKYDKNELKFQNEKDPFFVLPNGVALGMNPSFAGNGKGLRVNYNYNYQWPELNDFYNTQVVSVDTYVKALKGGVGVVLKSDVLGHNKFSTKGAEVIYSPKFTLFGKTTFEPSVKYGYYQKNVAWNQVKSNQLIDARTGELDVQIKNDVTDATSSSVNYSNLGVGFLLNTSKLFVGFAYDHLLNANYDFDGISENVQVPGKVTAQVGGSIVPVKDMEFLVLSPSLHFIKIGGYDKVWLSNVVEVSRLFIGTSYSFNNDYLFSLGYDNDILRISYSYGKTKSILDPSSKNLSLHQVGVVFNFIPSKR